MEQKQNYSNYKPRKVYNGNKFGKFTYNKPLTSVMKKQVRQIVNYQTTTQAEKKYTDRTNFNIGASNGGQIDQMTVSAGPNATDTARVGDKFTIKTLRVRATLSVADATNQFRLIYFQWHLDTSKTNGTPQVSDILNTIDWYSQYNHDQGKNFSIFYDKTFSLNSMGEATRTIDLMFNFKGNKSKDKKLKWVNPVIKYIAGGNTGIDQIYQLVISDSLAAPNPTFQGSTRILFIDP